MWKGSSNTENESYFFCKRGRKYRNSIRPNRVTGSGFWKATGIDKPVYSDSNQSNSVIIGLKKTLVYYRGSAGKGTKTEWMMHEFRLPTNSDNFNNPNSTSSSSQEAEVWTLCRIFKRNVSNRKYTPDWRDLASSKRIKRHQTHTSSTALHQEAYINFGDTDSTNVIHHYINEKNDVERNMFSYPNPQSSTPQDAQAVATALPVGSVPEFSNAVEDNDQVFSYGNWDELRSMVDFAFGPSSS